MLRWPITSRSTLQEGLYRYDAIGRLQEANHRHLAGQEAELDHTHAVDVGRYLRLGPLGTALLPARRPRVLVIDELDKSDIDLPNDLLNIFEEGEFEIPELSRLPTTGPITVVTADHDRRAPIEGGVVRCNAFPLIVLTSNGERQFPPPFLRRCVQLRINEPGPDKLAKILAAHLGPDALADSQDVIDAFLARRDKGDLATDQLLNAAYLMFSGLRPPGETREQLAEALLPYLNFGSG